MVMTSQTSNPFVRKLLKAQGQDIPEEQEAEEPESNPFFKKYRDQGNTEPPEFQESEEKSFARTALQVPQGIAEGTPYGIATGLWHLLGSGEVNDPEELDRIREISEREGIPFDEEKYLEAGQNALSTVPTVGNIASKVEEKTGIPFEAKTKLQKGLRFASTAGKLTPGSALQKGSGAGVATGVKVGAEEAGVPEPFADILGLGVGVGTSTKTPAVGLGKKTKPSGLVERQFENVKEPKKVSEKKIEQLNSKLESDFKDISDNIIKDSPVGETFDNLKNDPEFKDQTRTLLNQAQALADELPGTLSSKDIKKQFADISTKKTKGFSLSEYDKSYNKFMKDAIKDVVSENVKPGELVEQYRKNNGSLSEYFEPGASKALNNAKRDAILDQNRAIANVIEKVDPELGKVFKEGNDRWTKIMDAEAVDSFINELFDGKVNYKTMNDFFDKTGYDRIFKRALGDKGYKDFSVLMKDMLSTEAPYKMLKVAQNKGWEGLAKTATSYVIDPNLGHATGGYNVLKSSYKGIMNALLDKPKLSLVWKKGIDDLKKGDFKSAQKQFNELDEAKSEFETRRETLKETVKKVKEREIPKKENITDAFSQMGGGIVDSLYEGLYKALSEGKDTFSGVKDPILKNAKPAFEAGQIKNANDLRKFVDFLKSVAEKEPKSNG
jgi:hypothetical protein